jgi:hypothetical protein
MPKTTFKQFFSIKKIENHILNRNREINRVSKADCLHLLDKLYYLTLFRLSLQEGKKQIVKELMEQNKLLFLIIKLKILKLFNQTPAKIILDFQMENLLKKERGIL